MNLNDYRKNAYQNASSDHTDDSRHIQKPVFEHINRQVEDIFAAKRTATTAQKKVSPRQPDRTPTDSDVKAAAEALTSGGLLKVPESQKETNGQESIYRRVAKFLLLIGVDEAAKILPHLSEEQTEKIIPEIASIRHIDTDESTSILAEFQALVQKSREAGGVDTAKTILAKAFGEKRAGEMMQKAVPFAQGRPFEYLDDADPEKILFLLKDESDAVRALVLSHLRPKAAAAVINALPANDKKNVVMRLAKMEPVSPDILRRVDQSMHEKSMAVNTEKANVVDGRGILAQILKRMPPQEEQDLLGTLSEEDAELGKDLKQRLFTIEDFINSDDRFIQEQLRKMDDRTVAVLIAGKPDSFRKKILSNISTTRGDAVLEEEQLQKPVRRSDSDTVTSQFLAIMRQAYDDGRLAVKNRNDDIYV